MADPRAPSASVGLSFGPDDPPPDHRLVNGLSSVDAKTVAASPGSRERASSAAESFPPVAGRYVLLGEIARGGMGVVLRARDMELGRDLAVKLMLSNQPTPEQTRRFLAEARVAAQLQHPGVPPIHEVGRLPDGRPFIAMKLVEGRTLAELLTGRAAPADDLQRFLTIFEQICQTVAFAHSRGVIHCDLKPSNVMVGPFGEVQVMDWGLAVVWDRAPEATGDRDRQGAVQGTPAYMPPEQARGERGQIGPPCDVFGLGGILCEILTGRPPYIGLSSTHVFQMAHAADLEAMWGRLQTCGADAELVRLATDCLAIRPLERPADAAAAAGVLSRYLAGVRERLRAAEMEQARAQARATAERRARRWRSGLAASVFATLLILGGVWSWQTRERESAARDVEVNLQEAAHLQSDAKWAEARAAVGRAEGKLDRCGSDDLRRRARQARADLELVARLEEVRLEQTQVRNGSFDSAGAVPGYVAAFRDYGIDMEELEPAEAARRIRESAVRDQLIAGLDNWCMIAPPESPGRDRLFAVADLADPDDWRNPFREGVRRRDAAEVERLAGQVDPTALTPGVASLLSQALVVPVSPAELERLRAAQRRYPGDFWITHQLGQALCLTNPPHPDEAVGFYRAAVALRPQSPGVHVNLGCVLHQLSRDAEAEASFREAIRLKPDYAEARQNLGVVLSNQGRNAEAADAEREAIRLKPDCAAAYNSLGAALKGVNDLGGAEAAFREAVRRDPTVGDFSYNLAEVLSRRGRNEDAEAAYREAIRRDPDCTKAHYNLGGMFLAAARLEEAAAAFQEAIRCDADFAEAHCNLGHALVRQGRFAEALVPLRRGHELGLKKPAGEWPYPSAAWVQNAERLADLDAKLNAVARGAAPPLTPDDLVGLALFCHQTKGRHAAAADFFAAAFAARPNLADDPRNGLRYQAACAAALAATGQAGDGRVPDEPQRERYRGQALDWLRADLASWARQSHADARTALNQWRSATDLAGVREADGLSRLSKADAREWRGFWTDVDALWDQAEKAP